MKRTVSVACALVLVLGLWVSGALAHDYLNNTMVQPNTGGAYQNARTNPIQSQPYFNTYGADWDGSVLTIFSNWGPARDGYLGVTTADLFIDLGCDGTYDFSVGLDTNPNGQGLNRAGIVYNGAITTSFAGGTFGLRVDPASPHLIPVLMGTDTGNTTTVTWNTEAGSPDYSVAVDLSSLVSGKFGFIWASATCANGPMEACVPIPPSVLLMGSGLLGVGLLGWRRQGSEDQVG
jgi:hypothetical protein